MMMVPDFQTSSPAHPVPKPLFKKVVIKVSQGRIRELRQSGQSEGKHINNIVVKDIIVA